MPDLSLSPGDLAALADLTAAGVAERLAGEGGLSPGRLWTEEDCANYLGVSVPTVRRLRSAGQIPFVTLDGRGQKRGVVRFEPLQVAAWARAGGCRVRGRRRKKTG